MMINRLGGISANGAQKINLSEREYLACTPNMRNRQKLPSDPCDGGAFASFSFCKRHHSSPPGWPTDVFPWAAANGLINEVCPQLAPTLMHVLLADRMAILPVAKLRDLGHVLCQDGCVAGFGAVRAGVYQHHRLVVHPCR